MEAGKLFTYLIFIVVPIVMLIILVSIAWNFSSPEECRNIINGTVSQILGNIRKCTELCWVKHNSGRDIYVDDCFAVNISSESSISKELLASRLSDRPVSIYFDLLEKEKYYTIKIRYNSTVPEIGIYMFELIQESTTTT